MYSSKDGEPQGHRAWVVHPPALVQSCQCLDVLFWEVEIVGLEVGLGTCWVA